MDKAIEILKEILKKKDRISIYEIRNLRRAHGIKKSEMKAAKKHLGLETIHFSNGYYWVDVS